MPRAFSEIAFTPAVRAFQARMGSRRNYAGLDVTDDRGDALTDLEAQFIAGRDGFYQATVGEGGWPYVQFRGGPAGFLRVIDARTIGYADFRGNVQYISAGNIESDGRVSLILMDYAARRRLKIWGRASLVDPTADPALLGKLEMPAYRARVERAVLINIEAFDWNCPQHITPRFTEAEIAAASAPLHEEVRQLRASLARSSATLEAAATSMGTGPLSLAVSGVRQVADRVRAFELRRPEGGALPTVQAGAHLDVPVRLAEGRPATRRYSITSVSTGGDAYEIAVLLEDGGRGGSASVFRDYALGTVLHCTSPGNDFPLHDDARPTVLVAGGIGITPIRAMAYALRAGRRPFVLHYVGRRLSGMAYVQSLARDFHGAFTAYASDEGSRLDVAETLDRAPPGAVFYACGPQPLIDAFREAAAGRGVTGDRFRFERFTVAPREGDREVEVELYRSRKTIRVAARQSILDAVTEAGVRVTSACGAGACGTCATKVLAGAPEHRDSALSGPERDQAALMCICVSRATSDRLVLDL